MQSDALAGAGGNSATVVGDVQLQFVAMGCESQPTVACLGVSLDVGHGLYGYVERSDFGRRRQWLSVVRQLQVDGNAVSLQLA